MSRIPTVESGRRQLRTANEANIRAFVRYRTKLTLFVVAGYIILNSGFMLLRIPPVGVGLPIGQLVILLYLLTILLDIRFAKRFAGSAPLLPLFSWWLLGLVHLTIESMIYGFWAVRDAAHWMETSFIWVGFVVASRSDFLPIFKMWLARTFKWAVYYIFLYPFRETLANYSPQIHSVSGYTAPLFFSYINSSSSVLVGVLRLFSVPQKLLTSLRGLLLAGGALIILVALVQARLIYLQIAAVFCLMLVFHPRRVPKLGALAMLAVGAMAILLSLDINLTGRLGTSFSAEFLWNHIQAIWGGGGESVRNAAEGVALRTLWWKDVFLRVNSSAFSSIWGLGFGEPLTTFGGPNGDVVREPHNSFVSVYGRLGLLGIGLFVWLQASFLWLGLSLALFFRRNGNKLLFVTSETILCFLVMNLLFSLAEGGFEVSYVSIPYYFFVGILYSLNSRRGFMSISKE